MATLCVSKPAKIWSTKYYLLLEGLLDSSESGLSKDLHCPWKHLWSFSSQNVPVSATGWSLGH